MTGVSDEFEAVWQRLPPAWRRQVLAQPLPPGKLILINQPDPTALLVGFWAALRADSALALANPQWGQQEWQQVADQLRPDCILGTAPPVSFTADIPRPAPGQILIPTGGTSGQVRFVVHTWSTLATAARGFIRHFEQPQVNSYCVLPMYHVSGLMQAVRVWLSGGRLIAQPFRELAAGQRLASPDSHWFISLVPTQLGRLLQSSDTAVWHRWLGQFRAVLLGGAPPWPTLLEQAAQLPLAPTYGMTETAAQVATLLPADFLAGERSSGPALPHVQLAIHGAQGETLPPGQIGRIALDSAALGQGYWRETAFQRPWFYPDDLGYLDRQGHLHVVGRRSDKIITGGENVFPAEVEAALLATGLVQDVCVVGLSDSDWGQAVAALYVPVQDSVTAADLKRSLRSYLSSHKHPKRWLAVEQIPRSQQGKVSRTLAMQLLSAIGQPLEPGDGDDG